jgi:hypothetical protein
VDRGFDKDFDVTFWNGSLSVDHLASVTLFETNVYILKVKVYM